MNRIARQSYIFILLTSIFHLSDIEAATNRVYVAVSGENRIAVYDQNEKSGQLEHLNDIVTHGSPKTLVLSPDHQYLFASISDALKIASFKLNHSTGEGSLLSKVAAEAHASFFEMDNTGRFLISAYYSLGKVMVHRIESGVLSVYPLQVIETAERAHSAALDPSSRFLFVPHTRPNAIFQFHFDSVTGRVTPNKVLRMQRGEMVGPRHFRFDSKGEFGYCSDEQGNSISTYQLNSITGRLTLLQSIPTLPSDFEGTSATSDVQIHPNGRTVYIANRGYDTLAAYSIDKDSGKLSFIERVPCELQTRSFVLSNDGRYLYAAGSRSNTLAIYTVNADSGRLTALQTMDIGKGLWCVLFMERQ
jgi:6-phosphogluconolactonase